MEGKKRTTNFTPDEKRILSELVLKYRQSVENKKTDAATNTQKLNAWIRLANEFNSISTFCHRNHQSLKTCWDNIKRQSKKDRANSKKEIFKTGGGLPPQNSQENLINNIVEAVLGPAVDGIPNAFDSDRTGNNIIELEVTDTDPLGLLVSPTEYTSQIMRPHTPSAVGVIISDDNTKENMVQSNQSLVDTPAAFSQCEWLASTSKSNEEPHNTPSTSRVIIINDNTKENMVQCNSNVDTPTTSGIDYSEWPASTSKSNDLETWTDWTPKTLKRPIADCLRTVNRKGDKSVKRRRPVDENVQDEILREKLSLVKLLKQKAEEEANIRILILQEQLKQQKIKTEKMLEE